MLYLDEDRLLLIKLTKFLNCRKFPMKNISANKENISQKDLNAHLIENNQ